jgi:hypothetical protein
LSGYESTKILPLGSGGSGGVTDTSLSQFNNKNVIAKTNKLILILVFI